MSDAARRSQGERTWLRPRRPLASASMYKSPRSAATSAFSPHRCSPPPNPAAAASPTIRVPRPPPRPLSRSLPLSLRTPGRRRLPRAVPVVVLLLPLLPVRPRCEARLGARRRRRGARARRGAEVLLVGVGAGRGPAARGGGGLRGVELAREGTARCVCGRGCRRGEGCMSEGRADREEEKGAPD